MEQIRNIFDRTRLCEGLRIPKTVGILNYQRNESERFVVDNIATFMERSGIQTLYTRVNRFSMINPFLKNFNIDDSVIGGLTRVSDMLRNETPEVVIWVGEDAVLANFSRIQSCFEDKELLNIYVSSKYIGIYFGKPMKYVSDVREKFLGNTDRVFGHVTTTFDGRSPDKTWYLKLAILATYFTVSEKIYDMTTENADKKYLFTTGDFHEAF